MIYKLTSSFSGRLGAIRRRKQRNAVLNQALSQRDPIAMGRCIYDRPITEAFSSAFLTTSCETFGRFLRNGRFGSALQNPYRELERAENLSRTVLIVADSFRSFGLSARPVDYQS
jgi:hypothetical protein